MKKIKIGVSIVLLLSILGVMEFYGDIWHTNLFASQFPIRGLDVSHYQNEIDWTKLKDSQYEFVYIKATEGQGMKDATFLYNWNQAKANNLLVGAYHFFTTSSTGEEQAHNFIETVPVEDALPAVIDIEISKGLDQEEVRENLTSMIDALVDVYGKTPILYVTYDTYNEYVLGHFKESSIWIRDIIKYPTLKDKRKWVMWQYCNRGHVEGIETFVDINVFHGSEEELLQLYKMN